MLPDYFEGKKIFYDNGYPAIYNPEHPKAKQNGTVRIHVLVMEKILHRCLLPSECVHHKDNDRSNYRDNNLMCFKTSSDHTAYHKGAKPVLLPDGTYICIKTKTKGSGKCISCGKRIDKYSLRCRQCRGIVQRKYDDIDLLKEQLQNQDSSEVAQIYNVSPQTVRKWRRLNNVKIASVYDRMQTEDFANYLKHHSLAETARHFDISVDCANTFIKKNSITIINEKIKCVETNIYYQSAADAARKINYEKSIKSSAYHIRCAAKRHTVYAGCHWEIIPKEVTVD